MALVPLLLDVPDGGGSVPGRSSVGGFGGLGWLTLGPGPGNRWVPPAFWTPFDPPLFVVPLLPLLLGLRLRLVFAAWWAHLEPSDGGCSW